MPASKNAFTIQYTYTSRNAQGTVILSQHKFVARREDGSTVSGFVVDDIPGTAPTLTRTIQLTDKEVRIFVHGYSESTSTTKLSQARLRYLETKGSDDPTCASTPVTTTVPEQVGEGSFLNYRVIKYKRTIGRAADQTREEWRAPALSCEPLYTITLLPSTDRVVPGGKLEDTATEITAGTPDPALFAVSGDYKERSPSAIFDITGRLDGTGSTPANETDEKMRERLDSRYESHKAPAVQGDAAGAESPR